MKVFSELSKRAQVVIWVSSGAITTLSYLMAYQDWKDVAWFPFGVATLINIFKSVIDYLMGRSPSAASVDKKAEAHDGCPTE